MAAKVCVLIVMCIFVMIIDDVNARCKLTTGLGRAIPSLHMRSVTRGNAVNIAFVYHIFVFDETGYY